MKQWKKNTGSWMLQFTKGKYPPTFNSLSHPSSLLTLVPDHQSCKNKGIVTTEAWRCSFNYIPDHTYHAILAHRRLHNHLLHVIFKPCYQLMPVPHTLCSHEQLKIWRKCWAVNLSTYEDILNVAIVLQFRNDSTKLRYHRVFPKLARIDGNFTVCCKLLECLLQGIRHSAPYRQIYPHSFKIEVEHLGNNFIPNRKSLPWMRDFFPGDFIDMSEGSRALKLHESTVLYQVGNDSLHKFSYH
mmetsp:Transcript_682/g.4424  ORF Transcript_682/g.4424 Transcript_682/m.4424 type:complete len:242 (-) Transcript_682:1226-1951(-)